MATAVPFGVKAKRVLLQTINGVGEYLLKTQKEKRMSPIYWLAMFANAVGTYAAYAGGDYVTAAVCLLLVVGIPLWFFWLPRPSSMSEKQRIGAQFTVWFLATAIFFGYAYEYQQIVPLPITVVQYTFASVVSVFLAYAMIADLVYGWKSGSSGELGTGVVENEQLVAGELKAADLSLEKV